MMDESDDVWQQRCIYNIHTYIHTHTHTHTHKHTHTHTRTHTQTHTHTHTHTHTLWNTLVRDGSTGHIILVFPAAQSQTSKETYYRGKRDLLQSSSSLQHSLKRQRPSIQHTHTHRPKETCYRGKRDLL
jgi:hypothetical protein